MSFWWIRCGCLVSWGQVNQGVVVVELSFISENVCEVFYGVWCLCFMSFLTSRGGILSFYRALTDFLCTAPRTPNVMVIRGLTIHHTIFSLWMRGHICLFFLLWQYLEIYHGNRWILWIVWYLMDLKAWVYGYLWGPLVYIVCQVLARPCMCMWRGGMCIILSILGLWCLGNGFVGCSHSLGYSTLCVCWIGVYRLYGILLCCVGLCKGHLCVGWVQVESRCGQVWISWFRQNLQLGLGYVSGQKMFFRWFPMYWAYRNLGFVYFVHHICMRLSISGLRFFNWFFR